MSNMTVLDVGSGTGFFAFEFEKRGAQVTSIDVPSYADLDIPLQDREQEFSKLMQYYPLANFNIADLDELCYLQFLGPFRFCHERMRSKVARHYSTIYNLASGELKNQQFDLVFLGDILPHLFSPLHALNVVAQLCRDRLIIFQGIDGEYQSEPLMRYLGGQSRQEQEFFAWWSPNNACLEQMLQRLGFHDVYLGSRIEAVYRPIGRVLFPHGVFHARRAKAVSQARPPSSSKKLKPTGLWPPPATAPGYRSKG
jgi:tRNA (mo5U34)-methyltransferase